MKYYIIAGEPSGDIYGSKLIKEILKQNPDAKVRCWGGELMRSSGAELIMHYKDLAFMGFFEVLKNIFKIFKNMTFCKSDILDFNPDKVIFIDYPGFNLRIAKWAKKKKFNTYFYISPQIWAWKESRIKKIKKYIDQMYVILPFEKDFYKKHNHNVQYFGHPLVNIVDQSIKSFNRKDKNKPTIAILPGSRKQEIELILNRVLNIVNDFDKYEFVIAGLDHINKRTYQKIIKNKNLDVKIIFNKTYELLNKSEAAIVTSGTATLETALIGTPQIVCYVTNGFNIFVARLFVKINFISLVNLILNKETVKELIQSEVNSKNIKKELNLILSDKKEKIKEDYKSLRKLLYGRDIEKKIIEHINKN
ncbi:MAG: lipid-A-disaccharide synthase [Flavobacteriales bacterium]|nr:lipid-A-disaccharide synthase [Flavobacteriales bacterium]